MEIRFMIITIFLLILIWRIFLPIGRIAYRTKHFSESIKKDLNFWHLYFMSEMAWTAGHPKTHMKIIDYIYSTRPFRDLKDGYKEPSTKEIDHSLNKALFEYGFFHVDECFNFVMEDLNIEERYIERGKQQ